MTFLRVWYCKTVLLLGHLRPAGHALSHFNTHLVGFFVEVNVGYFQSNSFSCVQSKLKKVNNVTLGIF